MDLRIVNNCNNNCLYCLEQSYRKKTSFIGKNIIYDKIKNNIGDNIINFYGGNSLLHLDLDEIITFCKNNGFISIGILTNTYLLDKNRLNNLISIGLNSIGFYFNTFDEKKHNLIVNSGISLKELLSNIEIIKASGIFYKAIIHINNQNIKTIYKDIYILNKKYGVTNIEFVNYFPFDRPYDNYRNILEYSYEKNRIYIDKLFEIILKLNLDVNFIKFDKDFFGNSLNFYNFKNGILNQIGDEDIKRLSGDKPFCFEDKRCKNCFIKDNCKFYE